MALHSKSEAARMAGVSRATINRRIKDGKLSASGGKIETTELLRVWPNASTDPKGSQGVQNVAVELEIENRVLKTENRGLRERLEDKDSSLEDLRQSVRLLEQQKAPPPDNSTKLIIVLSLVLVAGFSFAVIFK
jgi:hypothetical protein